MSERTNEWAQRSARAKRAVRNKPKSERSIAITTPIATVAATTDDDGDNNDEADNNDYADNNDDV